MWPKHGKKERSKIGEVKGEGGVDGVGRRDVEGKEKRNRRGRSDRGGGCLHLITGLCPSSGHVYYSAARPVPCNILCNALANVID